MEVLTKKIMEYFDLTFLNKSDLEEYLSRSAFNGCIDDFPVSLSLTFLKGKNPPFCKTEIRGQNDGLLAFVSTIMMDRWPLTGSNMGGSLSEPK